MLHTKPITEVFYRPPNQSKFLGIFGENLPKLNASYREIYFLCDYIVFQSSNNSKNLDSLQQKTMNIALFLL